MHDSEAIAPTYGLTGNGNVRTSAEGTATRQRLLLRSPINDFQFSPGLSSTSTAPKDWRVD